MNIVVEPQVWLHALEGGALIGAAATLMLLFNGRIAGVSGVFGGLLLNEGNSDRGWRLLFLIGLILGAALFSRFAAAPLLQLSTLGWGGVITGGLLVGFGTRMGNGCTSGHGICGMARLSQRSFVAVMTFMAFGFLTVFLIRHVWRFA